jgi:5'-3' exonuclease
MTQGTLIIDGNSLGHAAHNATKLSVGTMQTQAIFGMVKSSRLLAEKYPGWSQLVLWDGSAQWRKDIYPEYKGNRKAKDEKQAAHKQAYKDQSPFVRKALQLVGVRQMLVTSLEADDMAGILVRRAKGDIVLVSGDQDWLQLVRNGVTWFDPIRDHTVGIGNFTEFTGYFSPREFLEGKALMGDTSDNIPGVGGIGEKGAPEFLAQFKSVANFLAQCDDGSFVPKKKAHQNLASPAGRAAFDRNMRLMNLIDAPNPERDHMAVTQPAYSEAHFRTLCEKLAFMSILRNFDSFMTPFREMQSIAA